MSGALRCDILFQHNSIYCLRPSRCTILSRTIYNTTTAMEFQDAQKIALDSFNSLNNTFQKIPGSAMLIRYIQSSYQNDPIRSAIELVLVIFFVRYLLAPSYSTHPGNFVELSEKVCRREGLGPGTGNRAMS